jgi:hypothetical protein
MDDYKTMSIEIQEKLGMKLFPVGMSFSEEMPDI